MRNEPIKAYRVRVEKLKEVFKIKEGIRHPSIDKTRKQFCRHGHDTFVTGRTKRHCCCECDRIRNREYERLHKKQKQLRYRKNRKQCIAQSVKWQRKYRKYFSAYHSLYDKLNQKRTYAQKRTYFNQNRKKWLTYARNWNKVHKRKGLKTH